MSSHLPRAAASGAAPLPVAGTPRRRAALTIVAVLMTLTLSACGVRLEQAAPAPLVPTTDERVRAATVADVVAVRDLASRALAAGGKATGGAGGAARLTQVVTLAGTQLSALGGVYEGPAPTTATTSTAASTTRPAAATAAAVVQRLAANDEAARARLASASDPHLARLVAQVGTSQGLSARALAAAAHVKAPSAPFRLPAATPPTAPAGARASTLATVVESEDAAGYALEVVAARASGRARSDAAARAALHRARAQDWATAAGIAGTDGDPRRTAYALPSKTVARTVESRLTSVYATLLDTLDAKARTSVADLMADSARAAVDAGAAITALPGGAPK